MKRLLNILGLASLCALLSCSKAEPQEGVLNLRVSVSSELTKASQETADSALVNIYYDDFSGLVKSFRYCAMPQTLRLPEARYRVDVTAGEAAARAPRRACWDSRSYEGSVSFGIEPGQTTAVSVKASIVSVMTSISFAESVERSFAPGYRFTIGVEEDKLEYGAAENGAEGCFLVSGVFEPGLEWCFEGVTVNGKKVTKTGSIPAVREGTLYRMQIGYTETEGNLGLGLYVDYSTVDVNGTLVFEPVTAGLVELESYDIWASHVTLNANLDENEYPDKEKIEFQYSRDGENWISVKAEADGTGSYSARLSGLTPEKEYQYRLLYDGEIIGNTLSFTTAAAPTIPNGSFEQTSTSASGNYKEFYAAGDSPWWGSGNGSTGNTGSADFGSFVICKPDTGEKVDGSQSACLVSQWALVKFAAGNLFSGYFGGLVGTKGGMVYFGRPFTGRPTALKVWVKYSGGKIDRVDGVPDGVAVTSGKTYDTGRIQVALGTWNSKTYGGTKDCPILVNTTDHSTFVDFATDKSTIAFGDLQLLSDESNSHNSWKQYTIPLDYRNEKIIPTHIVISCASSMYGDYFTGCSSARMWVDKMELVYE